MKSKNFIIKVEGVKISREIAFSDNYNRKTVILAHGFSNDRHQRGQFDDLKKTLLKEGYAVCWFDFPGIGKSGGKFEDTTLLRQQKTLKGIIEYVNNLKSVDNQHLGPVAVSFAINSTLVH